MVLVLASPLNGRRTNERWTSVRVPTRAMAARKRGVTPTWELGSADVRRIGSLLVAPTLTRPRSRVAPCRREAPRPLDAHGCGSVTDASTGGHDPGTADLSVSVVIPARGSATTLAAAVRSALEQPGIVEVVVAVGSEDTAPPQATRTWETAKAIARDDRRVRVVPNPGGTTPAALNRAIRETTGDVIVRLDAHAVLPPGYVERALADLESSGAGNVGGRQRPVGSTVLQRGIAAAMRSRIGSGGATYRVGQHAGPADTVYLGVFLREALAEVNGYDERMLRNQDTELNLRLRRAGWTVWYDPELSVDYIPRRSLAALAGQYFQYGRWRMLTSRLHPGSLRVRQLLPPLAVATIALGVAATVVGLLPVSALALATLGYLLIVVAGTRRGSDTTGVWMAAVASAIVMHLAWGSGFLLGPPRHAAERPRGGILE